MLMKDFSVGWRMYYGKPANLFSGFPANEDEYKLFWLSNDGNACWWAFTDEAKFAWQHKGVYRIFHKSNGRWVVMFNQYQRIRHRYPIEDSNDLDVLPIITNIEQAIEACEYHFKIGVWI